MPTLTEKFMGDSKADLETRARNKGFEFFGHTMLEVDQDYKASGARAYGFKFQADITIREMPERKPAGPRAGQRFKVTIEANRNGAWEQLFTNTNSGDTAGVALTIAQGFWRDSLRGIR